jgi:predicted nuclease with TOPRIM domain
MTQKSQELQELQKLQKKYDILAEENLILKKELSELNESTVISSMNDMKKKYENLEENSVCIIIKILLKLLQQLQILMT